MRALWLVGLLMGGAVPGWAQAKLSDTDYINLGRRVTGYIYFIQPDSLLGVLAPEAAQRFGGVDGLREILTELANGAGPEERLVTEKMGRRRGLQEYWRESMYAFVPEESLVLRLVFTEDGKVAGIGIGASSEAPAPE